MTLSANPLLIRDAITAIHKTLRTEVFTLAGLLGKPATDAVSLLVTMQDVRSQILSQGQQDGRLFEATLCRYDPILANRLEDNHLKFAARLDHLCAQARLLIPLGGARRRQTQESMYLDWNHFVGEYLLHLDLKEREMLPAIMMTLAPMNTLPSAIYLHTPALLAANARISKPLCCSKRDKNAN